MATLLRMAFYLAITVGGWFALLLVFALAVRGRAWVWEQTCGVSLRHARRRLRSHGVLGHTVPPSRDQPVALVRRGR